MVRLRLIPALLITLTALAAVGCRHVGSGTLDLLPNGSIPGPAARQGPPVTVDVFRAEPGEAWPPAGKIAFWLRAENFPVINCGVQCDYLELQRLATSAQQAGNPPFEYRTCEELIDARDPLIRGNQPGLERIGKVPIGTDGTINALLLVDDTPENRAATWVLTDAGISSYVPIRCGKVILGAP